MLDDMKKWAEGLAKQEADLIKAQARILELEAMLKGAERERAKALRDLDLIRKNTGILNGVDEKVMLETNASIEFRRSLAAPDRVIIRGMAKRSDAPTLALALSQYLRNVGAQPFYTGGIA